MNSVLFYPNDNRESDILSIHKGNEVIRGGNTYSLHAQKLANYIYYHAQKNKIFIDNQKSYFELPVAEVTKQMGLTKTKSYVTNIKHALIELDTPFEVYNSAILKALAVNGQELLWARISLLNGAKYFKKGKHAFISGHISNEMQLIIRKSSTSSGNFTKLILNRSLRDLKSKHSYVLYEYIESFKYHKIYKNGIYLEKHRLDKMFNFKEIKKYKYFSSFLPLLERCVIDLNQNSDKYVQLIVDKANKVYKIINKVIPASGEKAPLSTLYFEKKANVPFQVSDVSDPFSIQGMFDKLKEE
jgi:hypothetical protein